MMALAWWLAESEPSCPRNATTQAAWSAQYEFGDFRNTLKQIESTPRIAASTRRAPDRAEGEGAAPRSQFLYQQHVESSPSTDQGLRIYLALLPWLF